MCLLRIPLIFQTYKSSFTQCAAVSTDRSPIRVPPHNQDMFVMLLFLEYPKRASHGYLPIGASLPPTILVSIWTTGHSAASKFRFGWGEYLLFQAIITLIY